jgi:hypothetical protein
MCFPRKASLGSYTGNRHDWLRCYRIARLGARRGLRPDPTTDGLLWKAQLVVAFERNSPDPLAAPGPDRLAFKRLLDEIVGENSSSGVQV